MNKARVIEEYKPINGFYDLRDFLISVTLFKRLWRIQEFLFAYNKNRKFLKLFEPQQWQKAQELSANYQQILFQLAVETSA